MNERRPKCRPGFAIARSHDASSFYFSPNVGDGEVCPEIIIPRKLDPRLENVNPFSGLKPYTELIRSPHHYFEPYAWVAFIPVTPIFIYPFDKLVYTPPVIASHEGLTMMSRDTVQLWDSLSWELMRMCVGLIGEYKIMAVEPFSPRGWGYDKKFKSFRKAMRIFRQASEWFFVWAGLVSFLLRRIEEEVKRLPEGSHTVNWDVWMERRGYTRLWIDGWRTLSAKDVPRIGSIFPSPLCDEITECRGIAKSPCDFLLSSNVPVWFKWDVHASEHFERHPNDPRRKLAPPKHIGEACISGDLSVLDLLHPCTCTAPDFLLHDSPEPVLPEVQEPPTSSTSKERLDPYSAQCSAARHQFIKKVFEDLEANEAARIARETPLDKQRRESRALSRGIRKAAVYVWEIDEKDPCKLVKQLVKQSEKEDMIDMHDSAQMKYFPAQNAWHLCAYLPDGPYMPDPDPWDDDPEHDVYGRPYLPEAPPPPSEKPVEVLPRHSEDATLPTDRFQTDESLSNDDELYDEMYRRITQDVREVFGFVCPIPVDDYVGPPAPSNRAGAFMRSLGWSYGRNEDQAKRFIDTPVGRALYGLFEVFTEGNVDSTMETALFDLNPTSPQPLAPPQHLSVLDRGPGFEKMYIFSIGRNLVAMYSPIVALAVLRRQPVDNAAVIEYLYDIGARFHTFLDKPPLLKYAPHAFEYTIPRRHRTHVFDVQDYDNYLHTMQSLLGLTRMRAAVMRGGYVWRLAANTIRVDDVLDGPSKTSLLRFEHEGFLYYDDQLTASEILLIIGSYELWDNHTVPTTVSWWPPPDLWDDASCGENYGVWTDWNESGYHARLRKIREGTARPLNRGDWKKQLRGAAHPRKWRASLHKRAEGHLSNIPSI